MLFEQQVDLALRQIDARVRADRTVDFVLGGLGIECKYRAAGRSPGPGAVQPGGNYYTRVAAAGLAGFDRLLILTNSQVAGELAEGLEVPVGPGPKLVKVWVAQWQPSDGEDRLRAIIQAAK